MAAAGRDFDATTAFGLILRLIAFRGAGRFAARLDFHG